MAVITGKALIKLLLAEGYEGVRHTRHGLMLVKREADRSRITIVKDTREVIKTGTLQAILGPKQTGLGMGWLRSRLGQ